MWMMFAVRDGRLCTSRALEAFRKLAMMLLWGLQVWIFRGVAKHFPIFIMLSVPSLARICSIVCSCGNPELSILHLFSIFSSHLLFTVLLKPLQTAALCCENNSRRLIFNVSFSLFPLSVSYAIAILSNNVSPMKSCAKNQDRIT